tara:strand:+ start:2910 stop:3443 length:534 start_codon:yes stop_codon:yes gene_type:complete
VKKLILLDHLGEIQFEADVYMDGQDFKYFEPNPKAIWLKYVLIIDPNAVLPDDIQSLAHPEEEFKIPHDDEPHSGIEKPDNPVRCMECGWRGSTKDCEFGHNDFYCPDCGKEALISEEEYRDLAEIETRKKDTDKEVTPDDTETTGDKGLGDKGVGETGQLKSPKGKAKKSTRKPAN